MEKARKHANEMARPIVRALHGRGVPFAVALLLALAGCSVSKMDREINRAVADYFVGDYTHARRRLKPLAQKTDQNFVLNNVRLGSAALGDYALDDAESAFLRAYEVINSVGVNNGGRTLGAVLVDEKIRIWKGEPFERAMANFYLGLIYYMQHDYANARGAFQNALFKLREGDSDKDENKQRYVDSHFALAELMLAKSFQRLGRDDQARKYFSAVLESRPHLKYLADYRENEESNLLLVIDYGFGPRKISTSDGAVAGFSPTPREEGPIAPPKVLVDGAAVELDGIDRPTIDLLALAQDRRWQSIDTIRAIKSTVGTGLIIGGAYTGMRRNNTEASLAMLAAGLLLKATSQADIRQWEMLPRTVFILPLRVPPGKHDLTINFPDVRGLSQEWRNIEVPAKGEATYYFRMLRWNTGPLNWPPGELTRKNEGEAVESSLREATQPAEKPAR